ncbi:BLUF domain-containing protein [Gramella sp. BOM4]|nr:BLUF domain-containing protein [Christiangramia bathymodioli]
MVNFKPNQSKIYSMPQAIAYVSQKSPSTSEQEIKDLLRKSQTNNIERDISGILVYSDGNFFQVTEGEPEIITSLFNKIKADNRHENIIVIFNHSIVKAAIDGYKADFATRHEGYDSQTLSNYLHHIQTLDPKSQAVVKNVLKNFLS